MGASTCFIGAFSLVFKLGHYLNKDKISKQKRWYVDSKLDLSLNDKTALNIISKRVSDKQYFTSPRGFFRIKIKCVFKKPT
jgi:hypothetical protein